MAITYIRILLLELKQNLYAHHQTHGSYVQGIFCFLDVAGPSFMLYRKALNEVPLEKIVELLPGVLCVIKDCSYTRTEHVVRILRSENAKITIDDNFKVFRVHYGFQSKWH